MRRRAAGGLGAASLLRALRNADQGAQRPGFEAVIKIMSASLLQRVGDSLLETQGPYGTIFYPDPELVQAGVPAGPDVMPDNLKPTTSDVLFRRAATIYGGSSEIQKNIVAKAVLDLPG